MALKSLAFFAQGSYTRVNKINIALPIVHEQD